MDTSTNSTDSYDSSSDNNLNSNSDSLSYICKEEDSSEVTYDSNDQDESPQKINYRQRSSSDGDEKFDLFTATESLRLYCNKLQSEKKIAKERERAAILHRIGRCPSSTQRYEELYNMGKSRIISEKEHSKGPEIKIERRSCSRSPAPQEVMERLYERSIPMQNFGKDRRKEIDKMRALSNTRSSMNVNLSSSPCASTRTSTTLPPKLRASSPSPTSEEVIERLYGRSLRMKELGKERRKEINKIRAQSNPRKPPTRSLSTSSVVSSPSPRRRLVSTPSRTRGVKMPTPHLVQPCTSSSK